MAKPVVPPLDLSGSSSKFGPRRGPSQSVVPSLDLSGSSSTTPRRPITSSTPPHQPAGSAPPLPLFELAASSLVLFERQVKPPPPGAAINPVDPTPLDEDENTAFLSNLLIGVGGLHRVPSIKTFLEKYWAKDFLVVANNPGYARMSIPAPPSEPSAGGGGGGGGGRTAESNLTKPPSAGGGGGRTAESNLVSKRKVDRKAVQKRQWQEEIQTLERCLRHPLRFPCLRRHQNKNNKLNELRFSLRATTDRLGEFGVEETTGRSREVFETLRWTPLDLTPLLIEEEGEDPGNRALGETDARFLKKFAALVHDYMKSLDLKELLKAVPAGAGGEREIFLWRDDSRDVPNHHSNACSGTIYSVERQAGFGAGAKRDIGEAISEYVQKLRERKPPRKAKRPPSDCAKEPTEPGTKRRKRNDGTADEQLMAEGGGSAVSSRVESDPIAAYEQFMTDPAVTSLYFRAPAALEKHALTAIVGALGMDFAGFDSSGDGDEDDGEGDSSGDEDGEASEEVSEEVSGEASEEVSVNVAQTSSDEDDRVSDDAPTIEQEQSVPPPSRTRNPTRSEIETFASKTGHFTDWHQDFQENFTIQLKGVKRWQLKKGAVREPVLGRAPHYKVNDGGATLVNEMGFEVLHGGGASVQRAPAPSSRRGAGPESPRHGSTSLEPRSAPSTYRPPDSFFDSCSTAGGADEDHTDDVHVVDLAPGDVLYFPSGMWHCVETVEDSLSINFSISGLRWLDVMLPSVQSFLARNAGLRAKVVGLGPVGVSPNGVPGGAGVKTDAPILAEKSAELAAMLRQYADLLDGGSGSSVDGGSDGMQEAVPERRTEGVRRRNSTSYQQALLPLGSCLRLGRAESVLLPSKQQVLLLSEEDEDHPAQIQAEIEKKQARGKKTKKLKAKLRLALQKKASTQNRVDQLMKTNPRYGVSKVCALVRGQGPTTEHRFWLQFLPFHGMERGGASDCYSSGRTKSVLVGNEAGDESRQIGDRLVCSVLERLVVAQTGGEVRLLDLLAEQKQGDILFRDSLLVAAAICEKLVEEGFLVETP